MDPAKKRKVQTIAYWVATILGPASFVIGGVLFLARAEQPSTALAELGYPPYLLKILGVWKILGAITAVVPGFPRLKEWMYAGFFFELTGAAASHALAGHSIGKVLEPVVFLVFVLASWALRPPSRRMPRTAS
jgi:uncharacterized membrane protein YphA (DoxX/SURF4 family)